MADPILAVDRMRAVASLAAPDFLEALGAGGVDPARDLRGADLRDVDFGAADVAGWDLRGADLCGADLSRVRNFDRAILDDDTTLREEPSSLADLAVFRDRLPDGGIGPEMVVIPEGTFMMGSPDADDGRYDDEGPRHEVRIGYRFALARCPVTFAEYDAFCAATGHKRVEGEPGRRGRRPATDVTWEDATAYCAWLSQITGAEYRLPSESEWEYACRAGTVSAYPWGDEWDAARANGARSDPEGTTEVGRYPANDWGLHDVIGNVWEWVADHWHDSYEGAPDHGRPWFEQQSEEAGRVLRGGSWDNPPGNCRAARRLRFEPVLGLDNTGVRTARTL